MSFYAKLKTIKDFMNGVEDEPTESVLGRIGYFFNIIGKLK